MAKRATIYISDPAEAVLGGRHDSLSGRINSIIIRYGEMTRRHSPALTRGEWAAIFDTLNGTWLAAEVGEIDPARYLWAEIADNPGVGEKWGVDQSALVSTLRALSYAESIAVAEAAQRFWQECKGLPLDAALDKLAISVKSCGPDQ